MVRSEARDYTWLMKAQKRERWLEENREAIETYNELVARHGVFSDGLRGF
jgi:antitoxin CcdA